MMRCISVIPLLLFLCVSQPLALWANQAGPKPFRRVLVLEGQNFNLGIHMGIYAGLVDAGWEPDLVISACGASIASAVFGAFEKPEDRLAFLEAEEFYKLAHSAQLQKRNFLQLLGTYTQKFNSQVLDEETEGLRLFPDVFSDPLFFVPEKIETQAFKERFRVDSKPRLIMLGSEALFKKTEVGQEARERKLFRELYFTDSELTERLQGRESDLYKWRKDARVDQKALAYDNWELGTATRASISDPYLMNPLSKEETHYFAGTVNLYPIELAQELGEEVVMVFPAEFDSTEEKAIRYSFGYSMNERLRHVTQKKIKAWVDFSDFEELGEKHFKPIKINALKNSVQFGIPKDREVFLQAVRAQYAFGKKRGKEALEARENPHAHIRNLPKGDTKVKRRKKVGS